MTTITSTTKPSVGKILPTSDAKDAITDTKSRHVLIVGMHTKEQQAAKKKAIKDLTDELLKLSRSSNLLIVVAQERSQ